MSESGLQMSLAKRLHFHFEATSVKGIYLLGRGLVAGELLAVGLLDRYYPSQVAQARGGASKPPQEGEAPGACPHGPVSEGGPYPSESGPTSPRGTRPPFTEGLALDLTLWQPR